MAGRFQWFERALAILALCLVASHASASQSAHLVYSRAAEASACPDESGLREAVARRLGYDPFVLQSTRLLVVEILAPEAGLKARVYAIENGDTAGGVRELNSPARDCKELIAAVALAISIAIDPDAIDRVADAPTASAPSDTQEARPDDETAEKPPTAAAKSTEAAPLPLRALATVPAKGGLPVSGRVGAGAFLTSGPAPFPALGAMLLGEARIGDFSIGVEPRWVPGSTTNARAPLSGSVRVSSLGGTLSPCYRLGPWAGCYQVEAARLKVSGEGVSEPRSDTTFWLGHGPRVAYSFELGRHLALTARLDALLAVQQISLELSGADAFDTPRALIRIGVDLDFDP